MPVAAAECAIARLGTQKHAPSSNPRALPGILQSRRRSAHCANRETRLGWSAAAVDGDLERLADLAHAHAAKSAQAFDQRSYRNALDRIEIDDRYQRNRVVRGLEENLSRDSPDRGRARSDQCTTQTRDRR